MTLGSPLVMSNMEIWHKAVNCLVWVSICQIVLGLGIIIPKIIIILFINKSIVI